MPFVEQEMARQDIFADAVNGDVTIIDNLTDKVIHDFVLPENVSGEYNERYCYGEIPVMPGTENRLTGGIHVKIPYYPQFKELKVCFRIQTGNGRNEYLINRTDNKIWFTVFRPDEDGKGQPFQLSRFHELTENEIFCLVLKDGFLLLYSGNETDLEIKPALNQNEIFLLKAMQGNLYQHPTTGVGLIEYLHGNFENTGLSEKLKTEFENDGMTIINAYMDSATGELLLEVKEKNG